MISAALSRLAGFCGRAWLGVITGIIWLAISAAGFATVLQGKGETGADILICVSVIVASMIWGGVVTWSYRREPMRKVATEIRDGQRKILTRLDEQDAATGRADASGPKLAVVRPFRRD